MQQDQSGHPIIVFHVVAAVPHAVLPFPLRGVVDAKGNTPAGSKARDAIPLAPDVRLLVRRDALAEHVRVEMDRVKLLRDMTFPGAPS